MNKIKIVIDRQKCQSAATCIAISPKVYELDDEYKAIVKNNKPSASGDRYSYIINAGDKTLKQTINGARSCPFQAIEIYDAQTDKKIYWSSYTLKYQSVFHEVWARSLRSPDEVVDEGGQTFADLLFWRWQRQEQRRAGRGAAGYGL